MAQVVQFPASSKPLCGTRSPLGVCVHVWDERAYVGDRCQCGAQRLPASARPLLIAREPGDCIEADER